jgi:hypothetical protein
VSAVSGRPGETSGGHRKDARGMSASLDLVMALSVRASVRGKRGKPGPRSPTCRELTYPAPRAAWFYPRRVASASCPAIRYDSLATRLARPSPEPVHRRLVQPDQALTSAKLQAGRPGAETHRAALTKREEGGVSHMADRSNDNLSRTAKRGEHRNDGQGAHGQGRFSPAAIRRITSL